jgi:uracil permease
MIVVGLILVFGLGVSGLTSPLAIGDVAISGLALAAVIGVVVNLILPMDTEEAEIAMPSEKTS